MAINLEEALAQAQKRGPRGGSIARKKESSQRRSAASSLAKTALTVIHRDEYDDLYQQALVKVNAERGPLPD
jgi:hypothetical protein